MKAAYDTWAAAFSVADGTDYEDQFLMNADPSTDVSNAIKITAIVAGDSEVTVTVESALAAPATLAGINGKVILKGAAALDGEWAQIGDALEVTDGVAVFTGAPATAKFFKAYVVNPTSLK